jgi:hypothetical protein
MEHLFSPCTRLRDISESQGFDPLEELRELNLDVSTAELLSDESAFTYADFYAMLGNEDTVLWLTPHAAVGRKDGQALSSWEYLDRLYCFRIDADGNNIKVLVRSPEHLVEICDVVLRLLAASAVHSVIVDSAPINALSLAYLMEHCQSLKLLTLKYLGIVNENHCRVLGDHSRPGLEIELRGCFFTNAGTSALAEILGRNEGPTRLDDDCDMDISLLANGLRGNSRLKSLRPNRCLLNRTVLALAGALKENFGLVDLNLSFRWVSDETWNAICNSLKTHPTLQVLDFLPLFSFQAEAQPSPALLQSRIQALVDMLKVNMSIHTIRLADHYIQHELFRESVIPYLAMNKHRSHVRAIQKARPIAYRTGVLVIALLSARADANKRWMLLSGNAEAVFPSTTATTMLVTNHPTPATTAAARPVNNRRRRRQRRRRRWWRQRLSQGISDTVP